MRKSIGQTKIVLVFLTLFSVFFYSCENKSALSARSGFPKSPPHIDIGDDFFYWEGTAESNFGDAMQNMRNFKKLTDKSTSNLHNVLGNGSHFVWVRAEFEIPPQLRNQPLGLMIPHLTFAEQLFLNGNFISMYGDFPPHEQSTLFKAHFFSFPINMLNQEGKNMILIRIYVEGQSGISSHASIMNAGVAHARFESINFRHTRVYMFFVGILIFTFILYLCFYINVRAFPEFRDFALMNIFTALFLIPFFATELPPYTEGLIPFLPFMKLTLCLPAYFMVYFGTLFVIDYHHRRYSFPYKALRAAVLLVQIAVTLAAPTYDALVRCTPFLLLLLLFQGGIGGMIAIKEFLNKAHRKVAIQFMTGFAPLSFCALLDITLRIYDNTKAYPYFSIFGWQISIAAFIIMLATRFAAIYRNNEQLSHHLQEEVATRTHELQDANYELNLLNERLAKDKRHSEMDLEMASVVQKNFFPHPNKNFKGWEISVCYSPAAKVSGDFYDYYNYNDILNGISLFDVSGHGLSASLVTMLSKNIISRVFQAGFRRNEPIDRVLSKINNMILYEKGDIDNYMTGILCRFAETDDYSKCSVELGNAGHPYPLKYSVKDNEVFELKGNDGKKHYGAIGMQGITVSFARSNFMMNTGDILVFYTDGLTEATNPKQEQFGIEEIKSIVKKYHARPPSEILGYIIERLEAFTEYRSYEDDVTIIIAKRMNASEFVEDENDDDLDGSIEELESFEESGD